VRLRQIEYFLAVADTESVTQAAADLFVAQPSLSQQVGALERELGAELFERLPRGVRLTSAGRAFLVEARAAVDAVSRGQEAVHRASEGSLGEIRLATLTSLAVGLVPGIVRSWIGAFPGVQIRLIEYQHPDRLEDAVRAGEADLGLGPIPLGTMAECHPVGAEEFVFVASIDDPIAEMERVSPDTLAHRPWVLFESGHGLYAAVRRMCAFWGFVPMSVVRTTQTEAAIRLAVAGAGPTVVPTNVISSELSHAAVRPVSRPVLRRLAFYADHPLGSVQQAFLEVARGQSKVREMMGSDNQTDALYLP